MKDISPDVLTSIAGIILSLVLAYFPGLSAKFAALSGDWKRATLGLLLILATAGIAVYQAGGFEWPALLANWEAYARALVLALVANQSTYQLAVAGRQD